MDGVAIAGRLAIVIDSAREIENKARIWENAQTVAILTCEIYCGSVRKNKTAETAASIGRILLIKRTTHQKDKKQADGVLKQKMLEQNN